MSGVPADFVAAVEDVFVLERANLRAKKGHQGYLSPDDILDEPMMRKVLYKYGRPASRHFLAELASVARKSNSKLLEYEPSSYLYYKSTAPRPNTSVLRLRPWAHRVRGLQRKMEENYATSKANWNRSARFSANAEEFVPAAARRRTRNNNNNNSLDKLLRNINNFRRGNNTRRRRN